MAMTEAAFNAIIKKTQDYKRRQQNETVRFLMQAAYDKGFLDGQASNVSIASSS